LGGFLGRLITVPHAVPTALMISTSTQATEADMIVVRNVFQLRFGKAREATATWKEGLAVADRLGFGHGSMRLLTDVVGPFYTLILESTHQSLADYEAAAKKLMADQDWKNWYGKVAEVSKGGYREIYQVVE
jgi:hypothetical protein